MATVLLSATENAGYAADPPAADVVRLVIDYGDGVETHFAALPWREGMSVLDALSAASRHARGVPFRQRGSGASALVTEIANLRNEGGGAGSRNWLYYVNDERATTSAGSRLLRPGDVALWKFERYE